MTAVARSKPPARAPVVAGAVLVATALLATAGCGSEPADGRALFVQTGCAGCHVLADASSTATMGPDLDEARPTADRVRHFIVNGGNGMPPLTSRLDDGEIDAVAEYVESVAGRPGAAG